MKHPFVPWWFVVMAGFYGVCLAEDLKCPKDLEPYANRCISQRMADYVSCIEASGGNHEKIVEEVSGSTGSDKGGSVSADVKAPVIKAKVGVEVKRQEEQQIARRLEQTFQSDGMKTCAKVLDPPKKGTASTTAPPSSQIIMTASGPSATLIGTSTGPVNIGGQSSPKAPADQQR